MNKHDEFRETILRIGRNLQRARARKRLFIPTVAAALDLPATMIAGIEQGRYADLNMLLLYRFMEYYELSSADIFGGT